MTHYILRFPSIFPWTCPCHFHKNPNFLFTKSSSSPFPVPKTLSLRASWSKNDVQSQEDTQKTPSLPSELLDENLLNHVSAATDANQALEIIAHKANKTTGVVSVSDCGLIISAALARNNTDLALSLFSAMRSSFDPVPGKDGQLVERWKWSRPDVHTYTILIRGLAASLRVSDALKIIACVCRVGVSPSEEVPFGKVVKCPTCMVAAAVAQPQHGVQIVSCSKCRYKYELVSGNICQIESEEIRISYCRTQHGCSSMEKSPKIFANREAKHSSCCSFNCGGDSFWSCTDPQVCY